MTADVHELLPLYALGMLDPDEAAVVERAIRADAGLAAELAEYQHATGELGAGLEPVAPSADVKTRLMASIGGGRFEAFSARMAKLFDVTVDRARELLGLIDRPASWVPQIPGIALVHFDGGPATAGADCGFIRMSPGAVFPPHGHLGEESVTILTGRVHDVTNNVMYGPGDECVQTVGTQHYLVCIGDEDCIYASRAMEGITVGGQRARPMKN